jgi:DNA-binding NarL/FixJ family response regulator
MGTIAQDLRAWMLKYRVIAMRHALVVEDQTTFRELLVELLAASGEVIVESCPSGAQARSLLARQSFDLVLLDLVLPDCHGLDLLDELQTMARARAPRVIVLTAQARPPVVKEAMKRGAHAVLTKGAPLRELREAIAAVAGGGVYYGSETSRLLRDAAMEPERDDRLTDRQREILRLVASGLSSKEIGNQLTLSEKTVINHRARIMQRLGVHDVAGLTRHAIALGLVDPNV